MPQVEKKYEDLRCELRLKALRHSMYFLGLSAGMVPTRVKRIPERRGSSGGEAAIRVTRPVQPRISELLCRFEPAPMQYLRIPRAGNSLDNISSSDEDDRVAVRRRSRDYSDDSAVELEPRRRHSHPHGAKSTMSPRRERTLVEAHVVEQDCEGRARKVRTPSVVVSDYSDGPVVGATEEEASWLRARSLSADSACSSCSTLSSREDDDINIPTLAKKM